MHCYDTMTSLSCCSLFNSNESSKSGLVRVLPLRKRKAPSSRDQEKAGLLAMQSDDTSTDSINVRVSIAVTVSPRFWPSEGVLPNITTSPVFSEAPPWRAPSPQVSSGPSPLSSPLPSPALPPVSPPPPATPNAASLTIINNANNAATATTTTTTTTAPTPAPIQRSRLLELPQEIRDEIYAHVFSSTRLAMGRRVTCARTTGHQKSGAGGGGGGGGATTAVQRVVTRTRPARHSLALFGVCRQITSELKADDAWISRVLFHFDDVATMVDVLGGGGDPCSPFSDPQRRARVREVRVREGALVRSTPHRGTCRFLIGALMRLLPGLQLDRLTILPALPCRVHAGRGVACPFRHVDRPAPSHELLSELLRCGRGWRELCYVHHDSGSLLTADRRRPGSLEAMMVNMGFWDADADAYDDLFADNDTYHGSSSSSHSHNHSYNYSHNDDSTSRGRSQSYSHHNNSSSSSTDRWEPSSSSSLNHTHQEQLQMLQRQRSRTYFASFAEKKEYRLPRWRAILAERDAQEVDGLPSKHRPVASTVHVYGVQDGAATRRLESLADVHANRLRGNDFMVVVRRPASRYDRYDDINTAYPFPRGDPRTLGYGVTWDHLRSFLFPWDYIPASRRRRDRYIDRDEYVAGPKRFIDSEIKPWCK